MSFSFAPGILIAMPTLADPNFHRSVVLLCDHDEQGAFGVVVNHRLDVPMSAVCAEAGISWEAGTAAKVYRGGPVDPHRGWLLHDSSESFEGTRRVADGLSLSVSLDGLGAYAAAPGGHFRLMLGYAGWGPKQLDLEVIQGAWLTGPVDAGLLFETPADQMWRKAMAMVGVDPTHLVDAGTRLN